MKKYFLTTALMGTFIASAFGADKIITSANTCTVDVLGVSDNNATANTIATWDLIDYTLDPGQYLSVTETSVDKTTCPAGSYCVGGGFTVETAGNSIAQCPTTHPNSAEGAGADTQCYTACTVATANIAHATAVSGNDYFGTGTDTCGATACETGYHVKGEITIVEKTPLIPVDYRVNAKGSAYINIDGKGSNSNLVDSLLSEPNTFAAIFDYGTVYGRASCQPSSDPGIEYIFSNFDTIMSGVITMEDVYSDLKALVGEMKADIYIDYINMMMALGFEGDIDDAMNKYSMITAGKDLQLGYEGQYCYCNLEFYKDLSGDYMPVSSNLWAFAFGNGPYSNCNDACVSTCASELRYGKSFRAALYGSLQAVESGGICAANTINIDWNPDNGGDHIKNMCTYEGSITLPTPDPVKPGYTFTGWKLVD